VAVKLAEVYKERQIILYLLVRDESNGQWDNSYVCGEHNTDHVQEDPFAQNDQYVHHFTRTSEVNGSYNKYNDQNLDKMKLSVSTYSLNKC